ncbi:Adenosine deaminase-like protein [Exaiptasia diaphana]|nr:Adenosine deaminase-like protein [Exaiptasia diaphana]
MADRVNISEFCKRIPKVELHAHLNGSVSLKTLNDLRLQKMKDGLTDQAVQESDLRWQTCPKFTKENFSKGFEIFNAIHQLVDSKEALKKLTTDVIKEFAEDNVKYLELRTTPKCYPGVTKLCYLKSVVSAIKDAEKAFPEIIVRLLVSIDRKRGPEEAMENVQLAYELSAEGIVCGVDLSGDPSTDDKGVFSTTLSQEYEIMMTVLGLSPIQVWNISYKSIDYIFADSSVKERLVRIWKSQQVHEPLTT